MAFSALFAISAVSHEWAEAVSREAADGKCAGTVELKDFVSGSLWASASDSSCLSGGLLLDCEGILAWVMSVMNYDTT